MILHNYQSYKGKREKKMTNKNKIYLRKFKENIKDHRLKGKWIAEKFIVKFKESRKRTKRNFKMDFKKEVKRKWKWSQIRLLQFLQNCTGLWCKQDQTSQYQLRVNSTEQRWRRLDVSIRVEMLWKEYKYISFLTSGWIKYWETVLS